ncbi:hypothetical protein CDL15_Pgr017003 [Punica granatum]|uniref:Uncharacterized protein n=1 Tax=Punica granatum TaxID=22663 RepID=A0A218WXL1_PUNGR|nr:hypothetical protein CDL15_Pgr017003 [Punica granatum]PKI72917.1 hypothetical protein CRG98_006617 [Punica granatum]
MDYPSRRRNRPEEKLGRTGRWAENGLGLNLRNKGNGPRPVSRRVVGIAGNGGDGSAGGGSLLWTPQRRHDRVWEIAMGTAWATRCPIWTSPGSKRPESRGRVTFFGGDFRNQ